MKSVTVEQFCKEYVKRSCNQKKYQYTARVPGWQHLKVQALRKSPIGRGGFFFLHLEEFFYTTSGNESICGKFP